MIRLKSNVGRWKLKWKAIPRGREGAVHVEIGTGEVPEFSGEVRWSRDSDGIWIQLPHGVFGFDLKVEIDDNGRRIYSASQRIHHLEWAGATPTLGDESSQSVGRSSKAKAVRVRSQMPGKIIRLLVTAEQVVQKDQPMVVMEAMKMENEIRAPQAGKVTQVKVAEGQAVETGAELLMIEPLAE